MQNEENKNKSRRQFLMNIPIAIGAFVTLSSLDLPNKEKGDSIHKNINQLSKAETKDLSKKLHITDVKKFKPESAPVKNSINKNLFEGTN